MASKPKLPRAKKGIAAPSANSTTGYGYQGTSGYTAADASTSRGYIYWPSSESKYALSAYVRKEVYARVNWLVSNQGTARHFANTIPRLAGPLMPQPTTSDEEWNKAAIEFFNRTQGSRMIHDEAGMENFYTRQKTILKQGLVNGDCFIVLTTTTTGNARTVIYEAGQVGNATKQSMKDGWHDGVLIDRYGKKKAICILNPGTFFNQEGTVINSNNVLHCGRFESPHSPRGLTGFIHAINHMLDIREIDNDTKRGIKAANLVGFFLTNEVLSNVDSVPAAGKFKTKPDYSGIADKVVSSPKPIKFEELQDGGGNVMTLNQGQDLKTVNDSRRHPNQQAVIDYFIHDCAAGFGMPFEVMWNIAGITGPAVRFVMRMAEKTLNEMRSDLKEQFCQPFWNYAIALAMKQGKIPVCRDPDWWKCNWVAPSALTIDAGRDSAAGMRELEQGGTTYQDWYAEDGDDWRSKLDQRAVAAKYAMDLETKYGLPPGMVIKIPDPPASAQPQQPENQQKPE